MNSYKSYNLVDYNHKLVNKQHPYYMTNVGKPVKLFMSEKSINYRDVKGNIIETPKNTLWASIEVTDEHLIEQIVNKNLCAFSVTVAEKNDADYVMTEYLRLSNKSAGKASENDIDYSKIADIQSRLSGKRTLMKDIEDPVLLSISLTNLPCVSKAMFCENIISDIPVEDNKNEVNNMTEKSNNTKSDENIDEETFFNRLKNNLTAFKSKTKNPEENKDMNKKEITEILKNEISEAIKSSNEDLSASFKKEFDELRNETKKEIKEMESKFETIEDESSKKEEEQSKSENNENKNEKIKAEKSGKSEKSKEQPQFNKSNQLSSNHDGIGSGKSRKPKVISERALLMKMIKGNQLSTKAIDDYEISFKGLDILPRLDETSQFYQSIHPSLKDSFSDSYTEETTRKIILPTNRYALYMRELLSTDPLMDDANFRIDYEVSDEERVMYALKLDEDPTQDGIMEENYYFDNPNITAARIEAVKDKLEPIPVRALLHISDRQIKQNVFGEDLVAKSLDLVRYRYNEGVARINYFGNTELDDSVDIKFRRRNGLFKQVGTSLVSDDVSSGDNTFNIDDGIDQLFKQMFRKLPFEAQKAEYYNLYVPPFVYEAYREYYLNNDKINFIGNITDEIPLKYKKITIKEAPILADNKGIELNDGNVSMLLTAPTNTHFIASRALRIEPERKPSTSSMKYWYTGDYDVRFAIPDYAVSATITKEEYQAL